MKMQLLRLNRIYSQTELEQLGLEPFQKVEGLDAVIFLNGEKVYFFSETSDHQLELYSVINKTAFYLK